MTLKLMTTLAGTPERGWTLYDGITRFSLADEFHFHTENHPGADPDATPRSKLGKHGYAEACAIAKDFAIIQDPDHLRAAKFVPHNGRLFLGLMERGESVDYVLFSEGYLQTDEGKTLERFF